MRSIRITVGAALTALALVGALAAPAQAASAPGSTGSSVAADLAPSPSATPVPGPGDVPPLDVDAQSGAPTPPPSDVEFDLGGLVHGTVSYIDPDAGDIIAAPGVRVEFSLRDPESGEFSLVATATSTSPEGALRAEFTTPRLAPGDYLVHYVAPSGATVRNEYYNDAIHRDEATLVAVTAGATTELEPTYLEPKLYWITRFGGADRYAVAANLSLDAFGDAAPVPVIYVASGESYPDALSAGPAAAHQNGGLLLTMRDSLPDSTRAALAELQPQKIVVVGGVNTVSDAVLAELAAVQPDTVRIAGAGRYESSRAVIDYAFCGLLPDAPRDATPCDGGATNVFVATGANFPDALAAGPAAAHRDGAVLLVPGTASDLDVPTRELLSRLGTLNAAIAGGGASVSGSIEWWLRQLLPGTVERFGGANRYDVAAQMNTAVFQGTYESIFVASGEVFADALSGGPVAASVDAPLYLVQKGCLPESMWRSASALDPIDIYLLGGPNTLNDDVARLKYLCR
ncbi:cell wall-binding repeat-containing protein [Herbiconiux sp. A18JL235]|uniref:Cell wall-binding repeat-containing protein n=1 Tax=Herbiconiux sp. A18JL235 TaxID=3152363 RepID=A0AB39BEQ6_9MICO